MQALADQAGVPPTHLASDYTLGSIASLRPGTTAQLKTCGGCSDAFVRQHGEVCGMQRFASLKFVWLFVDVCCFPSVTLPVKPPDCQACCRLRHASHANQSACILAGFREGRGGLLPGVRSCARQPVAHSAAQQRRLGAPSQQGARSKVEMHRYLCHHRAYSDSRCGIVFSKSFITEAALQADAAPVAPGILNEVKVRNFQSCDPWLLLCERICMCLPPPPRFLGRCIALVGCTSCADVLDYTYCRSRRRLRSCASQPGRVWPPSPPRTA